MALPTSKTKLVCTIGPASAEPETMQQMLQAGMGIARLNFSHGTFSWHKATIENLRQAARATGSRLAIMADLPGPKIRIGKFANEPVVLEKGNAFTLTTTEAPGDA
jgi:pyruvate kinase